MAPRLSIFIDGGYLFRVFAPYRCNGYWYSCKRLARKLSEDYNLMKIRYVDSINQRDSVVRQKQERFYNNYLRDKLGWETIILPLQWPGGEAKQKGTDAALTLHLHHAAVKDEYDVAILLAADSDYVPAVQLVKELGKIVRNAYFSARASFHLQQACNGKLIRLDDIDFVYTRNDPRKLICLSSLKPAT
jgi:uncharacterized LabA/DUF88 family protein